MRVTRGGSQSPDTSEAVAKRAEKDPDHIPLPKMVVGIGLTAGAFLICHGMVSRPGRHPLIFALALSWLSMVVVATITYQAFLRMAPERFRIVPWEHDGRLYERMGIGAFRWALFHTPLGLLRNPRVRLVSGRSGLQRFLREVNAAEGVHAIAGVVTFAIAAAYVLAGYTAVGMWVLLVNVPLNIYPWMLQRSHRGRVLRLIRRCR